MRETKKEATEAMLSTDSWRASLVPGRAVASITPGTVQWRRSGGVNVDALRDQGFYGGNSSLVAGTFTIRFGRAT